MYIIAGFLKHKKLITPKGLDTRPTTAKLRESLFNICQGYIEEASFLDVFAGSGAMGLEALSRGAKKATFIDLSKNSVACIRTNIKTLEVENKASILCGDAFLMLDKLSKLKEKFDVIYMDPPYGDGKMSYDLVKVIDNSNLLASKGFLFIEDSKQAEIPKDGYISLTLKSSRNMGKSQLLQFEKN